MKITSLFFAASFLGLGAAHAQDYKSPFIDAPKEVVNFINNSTQDENNCARAIITKDLAPFDQNYIVMVFKTKENRQDVFNFKFQDELYKGEKFTSTASVTKRPTTETLDVTTYDTSCPTWPTTENCTIQQVKRNTLKLVKSTATNTIVEAYFTVADRRVKWSGKLSEKWNSNGFGEYHCKDGKLTIKSF